MYTLYCTIHATIFHGQHCWLGTDIQENSQFPHTPFSSPHDDEARDREAAQRALLGAARARRAQTHVAALEQHRVRLALPARDALVRVETVGVGRRGRLEHAHGVRGALADGGDGGATCEQSGEAKVSAKQRPPLASNAAGGGCELQAFWRELLLWMRSILRMFMRLNMRMLAIIITEQQQRRHRAGRETNQRGRTSGRSPRGGRAVLTRMRMLWRMRLMRMVDSGHSPRARVRDLVATRRFAWR